MLINLFELYSELNENFYNYFFCLHFLKIIDFQLGEFFTIVYYFYQETKILCCLMLYFFH